jgi:GTP-binding protein EngB required for normal cell division
MLLLDIRRTMVKDVDLDTIALLEHLQKPYQLVLTKADTVRPTEVPKHVHKILQCIQQQRYLLPNTLTVGIHPNRHKMGISELRLECLKCTGHLGGSSDRTEKLTIKMP